MLQIIIHFDVLLLGLQHSVELWHDNFHTINTVFIHVIECQNKVLTNGDISNLDREDIPVIKYEGS